MGGLAEAVFASSSDTQVEYSYLKERKGFIRICIKHGKDIVPEYCYRATDMYYNPPVLRGWRARFSQHYFLGLVMPIGKWGSFMPKCDDATTVVFPPFPASSYTLDQL